MEKLLPRHMQIIYDINYRFLQVWEKCGWECGKMHRPLDAVGKGVFFPAVHRGDGSTNSGVCGWQFKDLSRPQSVCLPTMQAVDSALCTAHTPTLVLRGTFTAYTANASFERVLATLSALPALTHTLPPPPPRPLACAPCSKCAASTAMTGSASAACPSLRMAAATSGWWESVGKCGDIWCIWTDGFAGCTTEWCSTTAKLTECILMRMA